MKRSFAILGILAAAVFVLYRKSVRLYWTHDDAWFLHVALARRWTEAFTHADIWRQNLFTPLLTATYELFVATLWLEPRRWYAAQIVLLVLLAFAVFAALRLYVDDVLAAAGALLFIIGPPIANAAAHLGVIHYLEALLFVVLAFIAFAKGRDVLSAALYFVALLAKEIAAPLPGLLFLLAPRAGRVVPHAIALAVYAIWRLFVVGLPVAGYGWEVEGVHLARVPLEYVLLFGWVGAALLLLVAAIAIRAMRSRRALLIGIAGLVLAILPILPVARQLEPRFALMPWLWLCAGFALGLTTLRRRTALIVAAVVLIVAVVVNRQEWTKQYTRSMRMSDEAWVWVHEKGDVLLRNPAIPPGTMPELEWLKEEYFKHAKGARWFYDDIYLCARDVGGRRILEYDPTRRQVVEVDVSCPPSREDAPLSADFELFGDTLYWRLGPYDRGTYRLILLDGEHAWDVPHASAYRLGTTRRLSLRIGYRSPEGWVTYSPEIALDFTRQTRTTWRR